MNYISVKLLCFPCSVSIPNSPSLSTSLRVKAEAPTAARHTRTSPTTPPAPLLPGVRSIPSTLVSMFPHMPDTLLPQAVHVFDSPSGTLKIYFIFAHMSLSQRSLLKGFRLRPIYIPTTDIPSPTSLEHLPPYIIYLILAHFSPQECQLHVVC